MPAEEDEGPLENGLFTKGEEGDVALGLEDGGRFSHVSVRRHDCRMMENEDGARGSCVLV